MITAHDITRGKPGSRALSKGAALLGFAPKDCLVIEDASAGVSSGKAAEPASLHCRGPKPTMTSLRWARIGS